MRSCHLVFLLVNLFAIHVFAQEPKPITVESSGYPDFQEGYDFGDFSVGYTLDEKTSIVVNGFHEKTPFFEVFKSQFLIKRKIAKKLAVTGGLQVDWNFFAEGTEPVILDENGDVTRKELRLGLEYEPKSNLMIHVEYGNLLNNPNYAPQGFKKANAESSLNLGTKLKF